MNQSISYYPDCRHFKGEIPCKPHKDTGVHCPECDKYDKISGDLLIIKLGAIGDVIRTTPLLHRIKSEYPEKRIWWLTYTPEVLPSEVDRKLRYNVESLAILRALHFELIINLDKDLQATALASDLKCDRIYGFTLKNGVPAPANDLAIHKFMTGLYDDLNKSNKLSYPEEIFNICGWDFQGEEYILENHSRKVWEIDSGGKAIIGLNTGCGARWTSRLWSIDNWAKLIELLFDAGYYPLLLGGEAEHTRNQELETRTGAKYFGYFELNDFIGLLACCDVVVTGVTMALHLAIGLKKKVVLMNNIFNPYEFELYGRGIIIEPEKECQCYFRGNCINSDYFCLDHLLPVSLLESVKKLQ